MVWVQSETAEDDRAKGRDTSRYQRCAEYHNDKHPLLEIGQTLENLFPLEFGVLGTGVVESDSLEGQELLFIRQETGGRDMGRQEEHDRDQGQETAGTVSRGPLIG